MKRVKNENGFTLVELLCSIVILLLFSATVAIGMRVSNNLFLSTVRNFEGRTLVSTINTALSDELRYATGIEKIEDPETTKIISVEYNSVTYGTNAQIVMSEDDHKLYIRTTKPRAVATTVDNPLLPSKAYTKGCLIKDFKVELIDVTVNADGTWKKTVSGATADTRIFNISYDIVDSSYYELIAANQQAIAAGEKKPYSKTEINKHILFENQSFQVLPLQNF